ncbi:MAG: endonuclease [Acidimicrobiales bacterium]|nr:endonuclease [Acidimicrobiales bacterium]
MELGAAVERLVGMAEDPHAATDGELADALLELQRMRGQIHAAEARLTAAWDARMVWAADGGVSGGAWLAHRGEVSRAEGRAQVRTARRLAAMPHTTAALEAGQIGVAKARLLASARRDELADQFDECEEMLVGHARGLTVDQVARLLRHWVIVNERDGGASSETRGRDRAQVQMSRTFDDMWVLRGILGPEQGEIIARQLDGISRELYLAHKGAGDAPIITAAQRRASALTELARRHASIDAAASPKPVRPLLMAICDHELLGGRRGEPRPFGAICEIDGIGPVPDETARRLACTADIIDTHIGPDGQSLDLGRTRRRASEAQRRALLVRDRVCVFPGCDRASDWCEAHHVDHYEHGGRTDLHNLCLLCTRHHHLVHEGGYGLARAPDGRLEFRRPDGTQIRTDRPNHLPLRVAAPAAP